MLGSRFAQILRRRGMVRLLLPALAGRIPDSIAATGIVVLVRGATGSYTAAGLAAGAFGIGTAVSAPPATRFSNKSHRAPAGSPVLNTAGAARTRHAPAPNGSTVKPNGSRSAAQPSSAANWTGLNSTIRGSSKNWASTVWAEAPAISSSKSTRSCAAC